MLGSQLVDSFRSGVCRAGSDVTAEADCPEGASCVWDLANADILNRWEQDDTRDAWLEEMLEIRSSHEKAEDWEACC